jgi:hypothetical protein
MAHPARLAARDALREAAPQTDVHEVNPL